MPYNGRGYKSKTYRKRSYQPRRPLKYGQAKAVKRIVKHEMDREIENKVQFKNDFGNQITDVGTSFGITSGIAQGTSALTRVGDAIIAKRLTTYLELQNNDAFARIVRIVGIVAYAAEITWTDALLFFYNGTTGYEVNSPLNYPEINGRGRIFCDKRIVLEAQPETGYNKVLKMSHKFNHKVTWDRSGNTAKGHIVWFFVTDDATTGVNVDMMTYFSYQDA